MGTNEAYRYWCGREFISDLMPMTINIYFVAAALIWAKSFRAELRFASVAFMHHRYISFGGPPNRMGRIRSATDVIQSRTQYRSTRRIALTEGSRHGTLREFFVIDQMYPAIAVVSDIGIKLISAISSLHKYVQYAHSKDVKNVLLRTRGDL